MDLDSIDWAALERLRRAFLEGSAGAGDYWQHQSDLASYDQTFAQRIGWKWDYVLAELLRRGWTPPAGAMLDWGCGSGIAGRCVLHHFGSNSFSGVVLWDKSPLAASFAAQRMQEKFPTVPTTIDDGGNAPFDTLVLSHILTELTDEQLEDVLALAARVTAVLWVEPGTHAASRRLCQMRERLKTSHQVVAPCTHQGACGMLEGINAMHWCHHFAAPPAGVFQDGNWARFATLAGIDLRSLPLSFLVLDKRPVGIEPGAARVIGRPRLYKGHALVLGCMAEGVRERRLTKRALPAVFRQLKKEQADPIQVWKCAGDEIVQVLPSSGWFGGEGRGAAGENHDS